jgi:hypothetical protein
MDIDEEKRPAMRIDIQDRYGVIPKWQSGPASPLYTTITRRRPVRILVCLLAFALIFQFSGG